MCVPLLFSLSIFFITPSIHYPPVLCALFSLAILPPLLPILPLCAPPPPPQANTPSPTDCVAAWASYRAVAAVVPLALAALGLVSTYAPGLTRQPPRSRHQQQAPFPLAGRLRDYAARAARYRLCAARAAVVSPVKGLQGVRGACRRGGWE